VDHSITSCFVNYRMWWEGTCIRLVFMVLLGLFAPMILPVVSALGLLNFLGHCGCVPWRLVTSKKDVVCLNCAKGCRGALRGGWCWLLAWLIFVVLLATAEAPRPPPSGPRLRSDLERGGLTTKTRNQRTRLLLAFQMWLESSIPGYLMEELARDHQVLFAEALVEYGKRVCVARWARGAYTKTVNAVVRRFHWLKGTLSGAWQLLDTWAAMEPTAVHPPMPLLVLRAIVGTSIAWGWYHMAGLLLLAFYGLLRPCEMLSAQLCHILWPNEHLSGPHIFLEVVEPKTRARGPRHQHVRIVESVVVRFFKKA